MNFSKIEDLRPQRNMVFDKRDYNKSEFRQTLRSFSGEDVCKQCNVDLNFDDLVVLKIRALKKHAQVRKVFLRTRKQRKVESWMVRCLPNIKTRHSTITSLWIFFMTLCRKSLLGWILVRTGSERHPLQDEDHSGNDPHLFPGFFYLNSGMSPERVRSEPGLVCSEEIRLVSTGRPKFDSLSYWTTGTVSLSLYFQSLLRLG